MGFFKKIFKGIKKVFKKIGKWIKKQFKRFGKFMKKIGILGQIAMMFILPGVGAALFKSFGAMAGKMATLTGKFAGLSGSALGTIVKGAGAVLKGAHSFVQTGINAFKTVTSGITNFAKTALNKIPGLQGKIPGAKSSFFGAGEDSVFGSIKMDAKRIFDPFKSTLDAGKLIDAGANTGAKLLDQVSSTTGLSESTLTDVLGNNFDKMIAEGKGTINLDFSTAAVENAQVAGLANNTIMQSPEAMKRLTGRTDITNKEFLEVSRGSIDDLDLTSRGVDQFTYDAEGMYKPTGMTVDPITGEQFATGSIGADQQVRFKGDGFGEVDYTPRLEMGDVTDSSLLTTPERKGVWERTMGLLDRGNAGKGFVDRVKGIPGKVFGEFAERPLSATSTALNLWQQANPPEYEDYTPRSAGYAIELPTFEVQNPIPLQELVNSYGGPFGRSDAMDQALAFNNMGFGSERYFNIMGGITRPRSFSFGGVN